MFNQTQNIKFKGKIIRPKSLKEQVFVKVAFDKIDATSLTIEITIIADKKRRYEVSRGIGLSNDIVIENDWEPGSFLVLHDIYGTSYSDREQRIDANSVSYGIKDRTLSPNETLFLNAKFTPGGLFGKPSGVALYPDGNVKVEGRQYKDAYWETEIGTFTVTKAYEYYSDKIHERDLRTTIEATHVQAEIKTNMFSNVEEAYEKVFEHLILINTTLTLSARVPVKFYEIEFFITANEKPTNNSAIPVFRRFKLLENQKRHSDTLMHSINLTGKKFHHLAVAIQESHMSEVVRKSIHLLSLSRHGFLEQSYFYCFLALDYIIDEILKKNKIRSSIPSKPWKKIERYLKTSIRANRVEGLQEYLPEIILKLPELRRYSFNRKVMVVVKTLRVNTRGLWEDRPFTVGLQDAANIRNRLFHSGYIESYDTMHSNLVRLQFLLERIILRVLNWKPSQCWNLNEGELKRINTPQRQDKN